MYSLLIYVIHYTGAIFCLQCTTLADLIGVNKLPLAFGMVNFFVSVPSLTGPLIAGKAFI